METNENHPAYTTLQDKVALVEKALLEENITDGIKKSLLIWQDLLRYVDMVLNASSFLHIPNDFLNDLHSSLSSVTEPVIKNINGYFNYYTNILTCAKKLPVENSKGDIKQTFRSLVRQFNAQSAGAIDSFKQEQNTAFESWKIQKESLSKDIQALQVSRDNLSTLLESLKKDIVAQQTANQTMVSTLQKDYNDFKTQKDGEFKKQKEDLEQKIIKLDTSASERANEIIQALKIKQSEVEKLWGIIGKSAVSGQSQSYAKKAYWFANIMMGLALVIMGYAAWLVLDLTKNLMNPEMSLNAGIIVFRICAIAILFAPACYCMNVAKRQRDREFQLRDFEIKTAAFEPFMERMKFTASDQKGAKDTVKLELTKSFFDKEFAKENKQHGDILLSKDMIQALDKIADIIHKKDNK